jgi:hypothetical protein
VGIEIEMTGSGELGPIVPGWSVQEYATPVAIGNTAGGTGNVSFNAAAREESLFVVNNDITTTEENLGQVSGVVKSVSQTGLNVSITHNTPLSIFDATKNIPALGAGGVVPALDLCFQLSGKDILLNKDEGYFYSLRGHSAGFDSVGNPVVPVITDGSYEVLTTATSRTLVLPCTTTAGSVTVTTSNTVGLVVGATIAATANIPAGRTVASIVNATTFTINSGTSVTAGTGVPTTFTIPVTPFYYPVFYREIYGSIWANSFEVVDNTIWSNYVIGDSFSNSRFIPKSRLAFKTILDGGQTSFAFQALPDDFNTGSGQTVSILLDYDTEKMYLTGKYRAGGILRDLDAFTDFPEEVDFDKEFAIFIEYIRPVTGNDYTINIHACNTDNYTTAASIQTTFEADESYYNSNWVLNGKVRSIYRHQGETGLLDWDIEEYENSVTYVIEDGIQVNGPVIAQTNTNMWEYLQQACSAYHKEISVVNDVITARDIGQREIDITNVAGSPTVAPNIILSGRSVEIVYSNAYNVDNDELYDAYKDNNRVLSVKASETITTTVQISGTPTFLQIPERTTGIGNLNGISQYSIVDSSGVPVPQATWARYGGRVDVSINDTVLNAIDITLTGPSSSDGVFNKTIIGGTEANELYPGPYKLAFTADGTDYAALSIAGSGVRTKPQTLKLITGADPVKTAQDVAKTINNYFIASEPQAYDRGIWASGEASGPRVTLSGSIPSDTAMQFGLIAGSRIRYRDSIYRITEATVTNLALNFTGIRHVTVDDVDTLWAGKAVGLFDAMWEGYDNSDFVIAPLRYIGDNEPVLMFLDDDVTPYYDFDGEPEISVFQDTDVNPYYEDGGNLEGEDEIYLDTDSNPYDKDIDVT